MTRDYENYAYTLIQSRDALNIQLMAAPKHDTPADRIDAVSRVLWYEVAMLRDLYACIRNHDFPDTVRQNALLEGFLLHARQLFQFFQEFRARPNDAHALDLIDDEILREIRQKFQELPVDGREQCDTISKRVMHMTLDRGKGESDRIKWEIDLINEALDTGWRLCFERADRHGWAVLWEVRPTPSIGEGLPGSLTGEPETPANQTGTTSLSLDNLTHDPS